MAYGSNATAYQILNPGIEHWLAPEVPAVVGYTKRRKMLLVAGGPVCPADTIAPVVKNFEAHGRDRGCGVCYVCGDQTLRHLLARSPAHSAIAIGAQPVWNPGRWEQALQALPSLRAQFRRARNKGVVVETIVPQAGCEDPGLRRVLDEWLEKRPLAPLRFLTDPWVLDGVLHDRKLLVARVARAPVGFLVASPVAARGGYLIEQVVRSPGAPNGTAELLIDTAMRGFARDGCRFATLGLVALASRARAEIAHNPWWLRLMMTMARAHANRFYNFRGLEHFRTKMAPEAWEPIYAISNERRFSLRSLYAIAEAFCGISPWRAAGRALVRAGGQEIHNLRSLTPAMFSVAGDDTDVCLRTPPEGATAALDSSPAQGL
jgi:phosphatidylglycerol lysyltransferase